MKPESCQEITLGNKKWQKAHFTFFIINILTIQTHFQEFKIHSRIKSSVMRPEAECKVMAGGGGIVDGPVNQWPDTDNTQQIRLKPFRDTDVVWAQSRATDGQNPPKTQAANPQSDQCDELNADWNVKCFLLFPNPWHVNDSSRGKFDCLPKLCSTHSDF